MVTITIDEVTVPRGPGSDGWADFVASVDVHNQVESAGYGTDELSFTATEVHPGWLVQSSGPRQLFVARADGQVVGRAVAETQAEGGMDCAWLTVEVRPRWQERGIGRALADCLESFALADGRTTWYVYAVSPDGPGSRVAAPTGFGSIPHDNREVQFLLHRGYRLEQVVRGSRLALPGASAHISTLLAEATQAAGPHYRVQGWAGPTPERWLEDIALLYTRMSTDAPSAGLEEPEDVWTVARLIEHEHAEWHSPRVALTAAIEHRPTGTLVGFSVLSVPQETTRSVAQEDTLVLREHRGHRLGRLVKAANLAALTERYPGRPSVTTFNAEENLPMLAVNEAIGFVPMGYEGAWKHVG